MIYYVYIIQNLINNKIYVGKGKYVSGRKSTRWNYHLCIASGGKEKYPDKYQYVHTAINKYGTNNFSFQIIEEYDLELDVFEAESFFISYFRSWDKNYGYNLTLGGEGSSGRKMSEQTKLKIGLANTGRKSSEETKKKIGLASKGRKPSKETIEKRSLKLKGQIRTPEQRKRISEAHKNIKPSEQALQNMKKSAKKGELSPRAKITNDQAREIRKLYENKEYNIKQLAKKYGVGPTCISYIIHKITFKDV